jgi:Domain of unknown function (DUF4476)
MLVVGFSGAAQPFSYVYIQGDKQAPFYVKMEDQMLPRYGKNYCIIPMLAPGAINIEILFQQNQFPPESFQIMVPENSGKAFLLTKKDDVYELYDLQQKTYIEPIDSDVDSAMAAAPVVVIANQSATPPRPPTKDSTTPSRIPSMVDTSGGPKPQFIDSVQLRNVRAVSPTQEPAKHGDSVAAKPADSGVVVPSIDSRTLRNDSSLAIKRDSTAQQLATSTKAIIDMGNAITHDSARVVALLQKKDTTGVAAPAVIADTSNHRPIPNAVSPPHADTVSIPGAKQSDSTGVVISTVTSGNAHSLAKDTPSTTSSPPIFPAPKKTEYEISANRNCPYTMSKENFDVFTGDLMRQPDTGRLRFLLSNLENCFSTIQIRTLTGSLLYEYDKLVFVKKAYPHTTDQPNYPKLVDIFETDKARDDFKEFIKRN